MRMLVALLVVLVGAPAVRGQEPGLSILDGRTIRFIIGDNAAGESDVYGRALVEAWRKLLPRTDIFVQNLEGAGGALALAESLQGDGDAIVVVVAHTSPIYSELLDTELSVFHLTEFQWLGAMTNNRRVAVVRRSLGAATAAEAAASGVLVASASTVSSAAYFETLVIGAMTDLPLRPVVGVTNALRDAMLLAGEIDFAINSSFAIQPLIDSGDLTVLIRLGRDGYSPELTAAAPTLGEIVRPGTPPSLVETFDSLNRLGRMAVTPPGTDPAIVAALRVAFDRAVATPEMAASVERSGGLLSPTSGAEVAALIAALLGDEQAIETFRSYFECGLANAEGRPVACVGE